MKLETFVDLLAQPPRPDFLVDGVWPAGFTGMTYGPTGCGKTFLALDMAHAIATGGHWLARRARKGRAVYVAAEGRQGFPGRVQAWHRARGEPDLGNMRYLRHRLALHDADVRDEFVAALEDFLPLDFLVIDTASANGPEGWDDNKAEHWKAIFDAGEEIHDRTGGRCGINFIHHPGHAGTHPRGSYDQLARVDITIRVEKAGEHAGRLTLEKHRDFDWDGWIDYTLRRVRIDGSDEPLSLVPELAANRGDLSSFDLAALKALAVTDGPMKAKAWQAASGLAERSFYRSRLTLVTGAAKYVGTKGSEYFITDAGRQAILNHCQLPSTANDCHGSGDDYCHTAPSLEGGSGSSSLAARNGRHP